MRHFHRTALYTLLTLTFLSCCVDEYEIIGDGELTIQEIVRSTTTMPTESRRLELNWWLENAAFAAAEDFRVKMPLMAYSCGEDFLNSTDTTSFQFTLDRPVLVNGQSLEPGTNLADAPGVNVDHGSLDGFVFVELNRSFLEESLMRDSLHTARLSISTSDDRRFSTSGSFVVR